MNYRSQLMMTIEEIGIDRVLFAADWPFEPSKEAVEGIEKRTAQPRRQGKAIPHQRSAGIPVIA